MMNTLMVKTYFGGGSIILKMTAPKISLDYQNYTVLFRKPCKPTNYFLYHIYRCNKITKTKFPPKIDLAFSQIHISHQDDLTNPNTF